jgi:hypothetical protein
MESGGPATSSLPPVFAISQHFSGFRARPGTRQPEYPAKSGQIRPRHHRARKTMHLLQNHVVLSGCSGGGKSSLLAELARRGHAVVPEPGRRIVEEELRGNGRRCLGSIWLALRGARSCWPVPTGPRRRRLVGYSSIAAWSMRLQRSSTPPAKPRSLRWASRTATTAVSSSPRFGRKIYAVDNERRHAFADAIAEYERLCLAYTELRPRSRSALMSPWRRCRNALHATLKEVSEKVDPFVRSVIGGHVAARSQASPTTSCV